MVTCGGSRKVKPTSIPREKGTPCGKGCRQVTFGSKVLDRYEVDGDLLVFAGSMSSLQVEVYLVDLKSDKEWLIRRTMPKTGPGCFEVATNGKQISYSCGVRLSPNGVQTQALTLYDPATFVETDVKCFKLSSDVGACRPGYMSMGDTGISINMSLGHCLTIDTHFYRFADKSFTNLSNNKGGVWDSRMHGARIVWTEAVLSVGTQIVLYDTATSKEQLLSPQKADQFDARIHGDKIVWADLRNGSGTMWDPKNADIYIHDLKTGKTEAVTTHPARQAHPDVWGDWVVWEDYRNNPGSAPTYGQTDIYGKNLKTGKEVQLTSQKGFELVPQVDGGRVFYRASDSTGRIAAFMIDLAKRGL